MSFTASSANWASAPNFSFPERAARRARSGDTLNVVLVLRVNKQGGIDNVRVAQSSGNPLVDKEARRQVRSGKFKPFTKNGVPVVGDVTLPISYAVP
ncbi:energy transducer TonB [Psychrobacter sp. JCM 18901]|uniref:energy transducer TonB n=1 Tax=Psychrobacter sp. JCM 18901 TaxID=1298609 RepID=UPI0004AF7453|nr:energy transducer TonB [Psychrobacter sp. JCM 18901]